METWTDEEIYLKRKSMNCLLCPSPVDVIIQNIPLYLMLLFLNYQKVQF